MKLTEKDLINWWLEKYHDTNLDKVVKEHPEWDEKSYTKEEWEDKRHDFSRAFYEKYQCTKEQHDEWQQWAIKALAKDKRLSQKYVKRHWWAVYLNTAPQIKEI